jgi:hypothetical protein
MAITELKKYIILNELNVSELAIILDCSRSYLSMVANGHIPGRKLARDIFLLTGGKVDLKDKVKGYKRKKKQDNQESVAV